MLYDCLTFSIILMFIVAQEVDCMQQEADYVIDAFLLLCLAYLWATQLSHLRSRDTYAYVAIICCIKMSFFADQSSSLNFTTDDTLSEMRAMLKSTPLFNVTAPLIGMIILENKINRHHNFGLFNKLMTHSITFALFYYYFVLYTQQPKILASQTEHSLALEAEYGQKLKMVGNCIYAAIIFCCMVSFLYFKMIKNKTWENISVRNGLLIAKAAMLVTGTSGPLVYFCLIMQLYNFSLICNHRRDSKPGATFPIQIFFVYFTMQQYFFRSNHRERFSSLKVGKVCPGGVFCG